MNQGLEKLKQSNFQLPKGPSGHDTWNTGLEKNKKSNFQLPKSVASWTGSEQAAGRSHILIHKLNTHTLVLQPDAPA